MKLFTSKKHIFYYACLLCFLWLLLILKSVVAPIDVDFVKRLFDGVRAFEPVKIVLHDVEENESHELRVYRINQKGSNERIYREDSEYPIYEDLRNYWFGLVISAADEHLNRIKAQISIGKETFYFSNAELQSLIQKIDKSNDSVEIIIDNLPKKRSIIPMLRNVINYRGDLKLFGYTFILAIVLLAVYIILRKQIRFSLDTEKTILTFMVFSVLIIAKMLIPHINISELSAIFLDVTIFIAGIFCLMLIRGEFRSLKKIDNEKKDTSRNSVLAISFLLILSIFIMQNIFYMVHREATLDEGKYLIRGYWYIENILKPYGENDGNAYAPLYFLLVGLWQSGLENLFGFVNLFLVRLLPLLFISLNTFLSCSIIFRITKSWFWTIVSIFLLVASPFSAVLYNYSHPTVLVNTLILISFFLYIFLKRIPAWVNIALYSTIYLLLFFLRRNSILIIPWVYVFQVVFSKKRILTAIMTPVVSVLLCVLVLSIAPAKLTHVMFNLPYIKDIVQNIGVLENSAPSTISGVKRATVPTWEKRQVPQIIDLIRRFWSKSNRYYLFYSLLSFFPIILFRKKEKNGVFGLAAGFIYLMSAILHAIGAYAASNVFGYVHYSFALCVVASTLGLKRIYESFKKNQSQIAVFSFIIIIHIMLFYSRSIYRNYVSPFEAHHIKNIDRLGNVIAQYDVKSEKILIIDTERYIAQMSTHFAGGIPEPATLNLPFSHKKNIGKLSEADIIEYNKRNWWTNEIMKDWIEREKHIAILYNDDKYAPVWKPEMEKYFNNKELFYFPYIGWYTIYSR